MSDDDHTETEGSSDVCKDRVVQNRKELTMVVTSSVKEDVGVDSNHHPPEETDPEQREVDTEESTTPVHRMDSGLTTEGECGKRHETRGDQQDRIEEVIVTSVSHSSEGTEVSDTIDMHRQGAMSNRIGLRR